MAIIPGKLDLEGGDAQDETKKEAEDDAQGGSGDATRGQIEDKQDGEKVVDEKKDEEAEAKNKQEEMQKAADEKKKEEETKKKEEEKQAAEKKDEVKAVEVKPQPSKAELMAIADFECVCHPTKIKNPKICCTYEEHNTTRSFSRTDPGDYEGKKNN